MMKLVGAALLAALASATPTCFSVYDDGCGTVRLTPAPSLQGQGTGFSSDEPGSFVRTRAGPTLFTPTEPGCSLTVDVRMDHADGACTETITLQDNKPPVFSQLPDDEMFTAVCADIPSPTAPVAFDDCQGPQTNVLFVESKEQSATDSTLYVLTRTWTSSDSCLNVANATRTIEIYDHNKPVLIGLPEDETVECNFVPEVCEVTAEDDCDGQLPVGFWSGRTDADCVHNYDIVRVWSSTDKAGNLVTASRTVSVVDNEMPSLIGLQDFDLSLEVDCGAVPIALTIRAEDNCKDSPTVVYKEVVHPGDDCPDNYTIVRTWTAQDDCDNVNSVSQTIYVSDSTVPTLSGVDMSVHVNHGAVPEPCEVMCHDNCGNLCDIHYSEHKSPGPCEYTYNLTRTWTATDRCYNTHGESQLVMVEDLTPPVLTQVPSHLTVECNALAGYQVTGLDDNSGAVPVFMTEVKTTTGSCCEYELVRTWTAEDECGNEVSMSQTIQVVDTSKPEFEGLPSATVALPCHSRFIDPPANVTATDQCLLSSLGGCSYVNLTFSETVEPGSCDDEYNITRVWRAEDCSNNYDEFTQLLIITDDRGPSLDSSPAGHTVAVDAAITFPGMNATDLCDGDPTVHFSDEETTNACGLTKVVRTWVPVDRCGNVGGQWSMTIEEVDTTPPVITPPPTNDCECGANCPDGGVTALPGVTDDHTPAGDITVSGPGVSHSGDSCSLTVLYDYYAEDCSGNNASATYSYTIEDTSNPSLPSGWWTSTTVSYGNVPDVMDWTLSSDDCNDVSVQFSENVDDSETCYDTITRDYIAIDDCSHTDTATQVIRVVDEASCVFVEMEPPDITIECDAAVPFPTLTATDSGGRTPNASCSVSASQHVLSGSWPCEEVRVNQWAASDGCSESVSVDQRVTVVDTVAPSWDSDLPQDTTVECGTALPSAITPDAVDTCATPSVLLSETAEAHTSCDGNKVLTVTRFWVASDDCGNSINHTQVITVFDFTNPSLSQPNPQDNILECEDPDDPTNTPFDTCFIWLSSNYGSAGWTAPTSVESVQVVSAGACKSTVRYTWQASDMCDNAGPAVSAEYGSEDTSPPYLVNKPPVMREDNCTAGPTSPPLGRDSCSDLVQVHFSETSATPPYGYLEKLLRTWVATDECGSSASFTQTVLVKDTEQPTPSGQNFDHTYVCNEDSDEPAPPTFTDNCGAVSVQYYESINAQCDRETVDKHWSAVDVNGLVTDVTYSLTKTNDFDIQWHSHSYTTPVSGNIDDFESYNVPLVMNASVQCRDVTVVCPAPSVTDTECEGKIITRKCTASAECESDLVFTQSVTLTDQTPPDYDERYEDTTFECYTDVFDASGELLSQHSGWLAPVLDNPDDEADATQNLVLDLGKDCRTYKYKWNASDCVGLTETDEFQVTIADTELPSITCPAHVTQECGTPPPNKTGATGSDNCKDVVTLTYEHWEYVSGQSWEALHERLIEAEDDCGNKNNCTQSLLYEDTTPPVLQAPASVTTSHQGLLTNGQDQLQPYYSDLCSPPEITEVVSRTEICPYTYTVTRAWTVTDGAGNSNTASQLIEVEDLYPPVFTSVPPSLTIHWDEVYHHPPQNLTASDPDNNKPDWWVVPTETNTSWTNSHSFTTVRNWTTTDGCHDASVAQTITVIDTTPPAIWGVDSSTESCETTIENPMPDEATIRQNIQDSCQPNGTITCDEAWWGNATLTVSTVVQGTEQCGTVTRTWHLVDPHGIDTSQQQVLETYDAEGPRITIVGAEFGQATFHCTPGSVTATATDNCGDFGLSGVDEVLSGSMGVIPYSFRRTFTAVDNCDNSANKTVTISVVDTEKPTLDGTYAQVVTATCDAPDPTPVSFQDNCFSVTVAFSETKTSDCHGQFTLERTWRATDGNGGEDTFTQAVLVTDTVPPTFNGDLPLTVRSIECGDNLWDMENLTATDNCGGLATVVQTFGTVPANTPPAVNASVTERIWRKWVATDDCDNKAEHIQTIYVIDTTPPTMVCDTNTGGDCVGTVACEAFMSSGWPSKNPPPTASDTCELHGDPVFSEAVDEQSCVTIDGTQYTMFNTLTRSWMALDNQGGLTASTSQTLTVVDDEAPQFIPSSYEDQYGGCKGFYAGPAPQVTDCSATTVTKTVESSGNVCSSTTVTTWTASDGCQMNSVSRSFHGSDGDAPTWKTTISDIDATCTVPATSYAAEDTCDDDPAVAHSDVDTTPNECAYRKVFERTWTATDQCDNVNTTTQRITLTHTIEPTLTVPHSATTHECGDWYTPPTPSAIDNCHLDLTADIQASGSVDSNSEGTYVLSWSVSDQCGLSDAASLTVIVRDTQPPVWNEDEQSDTTVSCDDDVPDAPVYTAFDNCSSIEVGFSESEEPERCDANGLKKVITRTWTACDDWQCAPDRTQVITIYDLAAPALPTTGIVDQTGECQLPAPPTVTAEDTCGGTMSVSVTDGTKSENCAYDYTLPRTYTTKDCHGNTNSTTRIVTVTDSAPPAFSSEPADTTVSCSTTWTPPTVTAYDTCSGEREVLLTKVVSDSVCPRVETYTWSATDSCNNRDTIVQAVTFEDNHAPEFDAPADTSAECVAPPPVQAVPAVDSCDDSVVEADFVAESQISVGTGVEFDLVREWRAVDVCNNGASDFQTIRVRDTTAPELTGCPIEQTASVCVAPDAAPVTAHDACENATRTVVLTESKIGSCPHAFVLVRHWAVADNEDNEDSCSQTVTVTDSGVPTLTGLSDLPATTEYQCDLPDAPSVGASDTCAGDLSLSVVMSEVESPTGVFTRTWYVEDPCGNYDNRSQTIFVEDTIDPEINMTGDVTGSVECGSTITWPEFSANDNCDGDVDVTYTEIVVPGSCNASKRVIRIYSAKDAKGNTVTYQPVWRDIVDSQGPTLFGVPEDTTSSPCDIPDPPTVTASDTCGDTYPVTVRTELGQDGPCGPERVRTWTVYDECGNIAQDTQTIAVVDQTVPVMAQEPEHVTVECGNVEPACENVAMGDCGLHYTVTLSVTGTEDAGSQIVRTWAATSCAGNESSHTQTITVVDTTKPQFTRLPQDETVDCSCEEEPQPPEILAIDNCDNDEDLDVAYIQTRIDNTDHTYELHREWSVCDSSGVCNSHNQKVTVVDTTDPELWGVPISPDAAVSCRSPALAEAFSGQAVYVSDNCDATPTLSEVGQKVNETCKNRFAYTREWTVADATGNTASASQTLHVFDQTAPTLAHTQGVCVYRGVDENRMYKKFIVNEFLPVQDDCDDVVDIELVSCNCSQPNFNTIEDAWDKDCFVERQSIGGSTVDVLFVRADTINGDDRDYTVYAKAKDACDNEAAISRTITIHHNDPGTECATPTEHREFTGDPQAPVQVTSSPL